MRRVAAAVMAVVMLFLLAGCGEGSNTYLYESKDKDWSVRIPKEFELEKEEADEQLKSYNVTFKSENDWTLVINEMVDAEFVLNEDALKQELSEDHYLKVEQYENMDIEGVGKAYGALVTDNATGMGMMYYRVKHKDKVVSFIAYKKLGFPAAEEARIKSMVTTFKGLQ